MNEKNVNAIFKIFKKENPSPQTELKYNNKFELLVAVMLSAQATDVSVNKATSVLYKKANTPEAIFALGEEGLKEYIKTIGLYNSKAKHVIKTCEILINDYDGQVPRDRKALEKLPGVGRKTANVVLNVAFGEPTLAVDTHIFRVSNRIGLAKAKTPLGVEKQLLDVIPKAYLHDAHHWLILHGRYTCIARKPRCSACPIYKYCEFPDKNDEAS